MNRKQANLLIIMSGVCFIAAACIFVELAGLVGLADWLVE